MNFMPPPNWRHLQVAHAVCRQGCIRKAASHLGLVHSTVSRRIADLEEHLGFRLFELSPNGLNINPIVESLLCELDELADRLDSVIVGIDTYRQQLDGAISVTCAQGIHFPGLVGRFGEFMQHNPSVTVLMNTEHQITEVIPECGIFTTPSTNHSELPDALHDDIITPCGTIRWVLYEGSRTTSQVICGTPYRWIYGPNLDRLGFAHRTEVPCQSLQSVHDAIACNLGFGWLPESVGNADSRLKKLSGLGVPDSTIYGVFFVLRHAYAQSARHRALRTYLIQHQPGDLFFGPITEKQQITAEDGSPERPQDMALMSPRPTPDSARQDHPHTAQ